MAYRLAVPPVDAFHRDYSSSCYGHSLAGIDKSKNQAYDFCTAESSAGGIAVLMIAAQPQPLRFFCAQRTAFHFGGLGGAAAMLAGAIPALQLRSVRLPIIAVVRRRVLNPNRIAIMTTQSIAVIGENHVSILFFQDQPVITLAMMDQVHGSAGRGLSYF